MLQRVYVPHRLLHAAAASCRVLHSFDLGFNIPEDPFRKFKARGIHLTWGILENEVVARGLRHQELGFTVEGLSV